MSLVESKAVTGTVGTIPTQPDGSADAIIQAVNRSAVVVIARESGSRFPNFNKIVKVGYNAIEAVAQMNAMAQGQAINMFTGMPSMVGAAQQLPTQPVKPVEDPKILKMEKKLHWMEKQLAETKNGISELLKRVPA